MATPSPFRPKVGPRAAPSFHEQVVVAMRAEIQEQGALLGLFEEQQRAIINRDSVKVMALVTVIQKQVEVAQMARGRREMLMAQALKRARISPQTPLMQLIPQFPAAIQPLMRALVEEVIRIADRVRAKANQNQVLLARSIELIRELLEEVSPQPGGRIYDEGGSVKMKLLGTGKAYIT